MDHAKLMTQASLLRAKLGEDGLSPINVFALAQSMEKLTIVFYPMGDNLSGMCIKGQDENALIAINSGMTIGRQRFSLAHEFYHLFYDDNMISVCAKKMNTQSADMFASYFLMPEAALIMQAEKLTKGVQGKHLTLDDVIHIEQFFEVSHQAAIYRLMHTIYLDEDEANEYLNLPVRSRAESLGLNSDLYKPSPVNERYKTYGNYINQAKQLFASKRISHGKYEELLLCAFRDDLVYGKEEGDVID